MSSEEESSTPVPVMEACRQEEEEEEQVEEFIDVSTVSPTPGNVRLQAAIMADIGDQLLSEFLEEDSPPSEILSAPSNVFENPGGDIFIPPEIDPGAQVQFTLQPLIPGKVHSPVVSPDLLRPLKIDIPPPSNA